jgi:acetolactate synthase regulatory subunit
VGEVAYRLELSNQLSDVHDVFHISQLKKSLQSHDKEPLPMDGLTVKEDLTYTERPIRILETLARVTRNRVIRMCKVQWSNHAEDEATWEREDELKEDYPDLFVDPSESQGRDL